MNVFVKITTYIACMVVLLKNSTLFNRPRASQGVPLLISYLIDICLLALAFVFTSDLFNFLRDNEDEEVEGEFYEARVTVWNGEEDIFSELQEELGENISINNEGKLEIQTPKGVEVLNIGDWIMETPDQKFYICKPDIFQEPGEEDEN